MGNTTSSTGHSRKASFLKGRRSIRPAPTNKAKANKKVRNQRADPNSVVIANTDLIISEGDERAPRLLSESLSTTDDDSRPVWVSYERRNESLPEDAPPAVKMIHQWTRYIDQVDIENLIPMYDENCTITFVDNEVDVLLNEVMGILGDLYASFPDLKFYWKNIRLVPQEDLSPEDQDADVTLVVLDDYHGVGTHTGAPFAFGPFPAISATGKKVVDEKQDVTFWVSNKTGKILSLATDSFGKPSGPVNYYTQVGGLII